MKRVDEAYDWAVFSALPHAENNVSACQFFIVSQSPLSTVCSADKAAQSYSYSLRLVNVLEW